jgi:recombination protein RecA
MFDLTKDQRSIIVGSLLGDGSMRCKKNALLEINHCLKQRSYVDWKWQLLENLVRTPPKARSGNAGRQAYRFTTLSLPQLTPFYEAFYMGGRKAVPEIELTPLALAVWFMDDGCKSHRAVYLNTQQFDKSSQALLLDNLNAQLGVKASLNRDKSYFRIRVAVKSMERFRDLVKPYLLDEFAYKLPDR